MFKLRGFDKSGGNTFKKRNPRLLDRKFQTRFASITIIGALAGCLLVVVPVYHYIQQNYAIFAEIAERYSPRLLESLDHERIWVSAVLIFGFFGLTLFFIFLGFRVTHRIVGPVWVLRNHIRDLSRGRWFIGPAKIRDDDEFHDLVETYNYFFEAFRTNLFRELELLRQIKVDRTDQTSYQVWRKLIDEKSQQLDLKSEIGPVPRGGESSATTDSSTPRQAG